MALIKSQKEIETIKEGGKILAEILDQVLQQAKVGKEIIELDSLAEKLIRKAGGRPAFKGYQNFPGSLCVSINQAVVHGIPKNGLYLKDGDVVGFDIGMQYPLKNGLITDMARTIQVGQKTDEAQKLIMATRESFFKGVDIIKPGVSLGDVGYTIQQFAERQGFSVVRSLAGHGVGHQVHEEPKVPNYGTPGQGQVLKEGMVLAIEPMLCQGSYDLQISEDGWSVETVDGLLSAHYENTLIVTPQGAEIATLIN